MKMLFNLVQLLRMTVDNGSDVPTFMTCDKNVMIHMHVHIPEVPLSLET